MKFHLRDLCWLMLVASLAAFCFKLSCENFLLQQELLQRIVREIQAGEESIHGPIERYTVIENPNQDILLPVEDQ